MTRRSVLSTDDIEELRKRLCGMVIDFIPVEQQEERCNLISDIERLCRMARPTAIREEAEADANQRWSEEELETLRLRYTDPEAARGRARIKRTRAAIYRMAKNKGYI